MHIYQEFIFNNFIQTLWRHSHSSTTSLLLDGEDQKEKLAELFEKFPNIDAFKLAMSKASIEGLYDILNTIKDTKLRSFEVTKRVSMSSNYITLKLDNAMLKIGCSDSKSQCKFK